MRLDFSKLSAADLKRLKVAGGKSLFDELAEAASHSARPEAAKSKYGNKKTEADGLAFDSLKEASRYKELKLLSRSGEISDLEVHRSFPLEINGEIICHYEADFSYKRGGRLIVEDVKSTATRRIRLYRLKRKLMKVLLGIEIVEV